MTETMTLSAERRTRTGTGGAREARRNGRLPAVIYGRGADPIAVTLDAKEVALQARHPGFTSHLYEVDVEGTKHRVLARELQEDPVTGDLLHLDLMRFSARDKVTMDVEIVVLNEEECLGVKQGGLVNMALRTLTVSCRADRIPETIEVDIAGLNIGDALQAQDLALPEGVELADVDPEATVLNINPPRVEAAEEAAEEEERVEEIAEDVASGDSAEPAGEE